MMGGVEKAPAFSWNAAKLKPRLDAIRLLQGRLLGHSDVVIPDADRQAHMDALVQTALRTSEIEGESLNVGSVRSSVVRKLGLEKAGFVKGLKDAPDGRPVRTAEPCNVVELPALHGLHHGYLPKAA